MRVVQVEEESGQVHEYNTQATVEQAIWSEIHGKRFYLAEQAPICQGRLRGDFGYMAGTPTAEAVLNGSYAPDFEYDIGTQDLSVRVGSC